MSQNLLGSMSSNSQTQTTDPPRPKRRLKVGIACHSCRHRKIKCDAIRPACSHCQKKETLRQSCTYPTARSSETSFTTKSPYNTSQGATSAQEDRHEAPKLYASGSPGVFASEVKAAIHAKLGLPPSRSPIQIPMPLTDAPLFLYRREAPDRSAHHMDSVLPPRRHADHLMDIYWRCIQPTDPFLEQNHFCQSYEALFAGSPLLEDEHIFLSSLNTIFALSTQLQENLQADQREEASNTFFRRAWALVRPETILWEPGSLELVQCLLLMSRYLQCTNNKHQTWMAVGAAVRIAQSLDLHIPEALSSNSPSRDSRRRWQLWQCCVFMDRMTSWMLGRISLVYLAVPSTAVDNLLESGLDGQSRMEYAHYLSKTLELYEIASNHIMLSQIPVASNFGDKLGLPRHYQNEEFYSTAVGFDANLCRWEKSLPVSLRLDMKQGNSDDILHRQRVVLRFRLLHARILLFRPMLGRYCLSQSPVTTGPTGDQSLGDRLFRECALICLDNAQQMIALVHEINEVGAIIGVVAWWHRVFYLHVAGTILIASMLRGDLFTSIVSQSWNKAISTLRAHQHLSPFVQQSVSTFQTLASKVSETQNPGGLGQIPQSEIPSNTYFQDVFQDMGLDPDTFQFGKEEMSWLSNFDPIP